jgi:hypothetical protein
MSRPPDRPPKWGLGTVWDDIIPVALGLLALGVCVWLFLSFLHADW